MVELGRTAVWAALLAGLAAAGLLWSARRRSRLARPIVLLAVSSAAGSLATAVLMRALVVGDFSLAYVADYSRRGASTWLRVAALWGGMAGSLLWFATLIGVAGLVCAWRVDDGRRRDQVAAVAGALVAALVALVVAFADPFTTLALPPVDGAGLTPILEHPAMIYHPPLLYLGLATLVGPFALTVGALVDRRLDRAWLLGARRWALVAWTLLAAGMLTGSHWAYVELGWGGYWAWDPVENTALLPWLAVTLFLHAARGAHLPDDRSAQPTGTGSGQDAASAAGSLVSPVAVAGLGCLPFVLALLGSLLTRSGATSSVHAFAESRAIGRALAVVVAAAVVAVGLLLRRAASARGRRDLRPVGAGVTVSGLLAGHLVLVGAALAIAVVGTVWPLWVDLRGGDGIAVEGRYFSQFLGPLAAFALAGICLVPIALHGRRRGIGPRVAASALLGAGAAVALLAVCAPRLDTSGAVLAGAAGACLATSTVAMAADRDQARRRGGHLAHAAFGLFLLGVAGTATGGTETLAVQPGETVTVHGHDVRFDGVTIVDGPVRGSTAVVADVWTEGRWLRPSLVAFPERGVLLAETSLHSTPVGDVQVALRSALDDGTAIFEIGVHPLQQLVWWGGLGLVGAGGLLTWSAVRRPRTARKEEGVSVA